MDHISPTSVRPLEEKQRCSYTQLQVCEAKACCSHKRKKKKREREITTRQKSWTAQEQTNFKQDF